MFVRSTRSPCGASSLVLQSTMLKGRAGTLSMTPDETADISRLDYKYYLISFVDLLGIQRAKLVPSSVIADILSKGVGFAGSSTWLDISPTDSDILAKPDLAGLMPIPWCPEIAWLPSDLHIDQAPLAHGPRVALKRVIEQGARDGFEMKSGVEPEFFLISASEPELLDRADRQIKPGYDQQALMRRCDPIVELCDAMAALGWEPFQGDHEDANGQFELNWAYDSALVTADRHTFFKFMARSIAEKHGSRATFMPKPFAALTGSGCHLHVSLWRDGQNLFLDTSDELGLSQDAYHFIGGLIHSASALAALTNPIVNSYKRISGAQTRSGPCYAPAGATYGGNDRTHMIRVPSPGRIEFRLPDGASNPYLLQASVLAAGLDGIRYQRDPGLRGDHGSNDSCHNADPERSLPANLLDALRSLERSAVLNEALGDLVPKYLKLKHQEWQAYCAHLSPWELDTYLDC